MRDRKTPTGTRDPRAAWRQPDTNTSTDTRSLAALISARVKAGGIQKDERRRLRLRQPRHSVAQVGDHDPEFPDAP